MISPCSICHLSKTCLFTICLNQNLSKVQILHLLNVYINCFSSLAVSASLFSPCHLFVVKESRSGRLFHIPDLIFIRLNGYKNQSINSYESLQTHPLTSSAYHVVDQ